MQGDTDWTKQLLTFHTGEHSKFWLLGLRKDVTKNYKLKPVCACIVTIKQQVNVNVFSETENAVVFA